MNKEKIYILIMIILTSLLIFSFKRETLGEVNRYESIAKKRYSSSGVPYDDVIYIIDTQTGKWKRIEENLRHGEYSSWRE